LSEAAASAIHPRSPRSYWRRLNERTLSEMQIYERTRRELEKETRPEIWE
jgi:hypothetical protein